jgi:L-type amino acid transporter 9
LKEVRSPVRTLNIAGHFGFGVCAIFYMSSNVAYFAAGTPEVKASGQTIASLFMDKVFGTAVPKAISVLVAILTLRNVLTVTSAQARVNQELAKERGRNSISQILGFDVASWSAIRSSVLALDPKFYRHCQSPIR